MYFYLRNWQVTLSLYTLGVLFSEYAAKAYIEPRDYRVVFLTQKKVVPKLWDNLNHFALISNDYSAPCNTFNLFRYSNLAFAASSDLAKSSAARSGFARLRAL